MKESLKRNYIVEIIILLFIIAFRVMMDLNPQKAMFFCIAFWVLLAGILLFFSGFPRSKSYLNKISIRYILIALLSYLLIIYLLGLFTGFLNVSYSHKIIDLIKNITPIIVLVISKEIVRFILCKNTLENKTLIITTILFVIFDIVFKNGNVELKSASQIFTFITLNCLPTIAREALCTYMTNKISIVPNIIYLLIMECAIYFLPIYPDLGNYLNSVIGLIFPFAIYKSISKLVKYDEKMAINTNKYLFIFLLIPIIIFLLVIIILISGIFSVKMIAIGSDSMNPIYYRGDAIIYKKVDINEIKENDILVFDYNGTIITHRVTKILTKDNKKHFQTKGDNNKDIDNTLVPEDKVYGKVKYIVKYIGHPTLYFQELFK